MKITCDTEISEIIDPKKVEAAFKLSENETQYHSSDGSSNDVGLSVFRGVRNDLEKESSGYRGYSRYACNINGSTPLYNATRTLISDIEASIAIFYQIKAEAIAAAQAHRITELRKLSDAIQMKMNLIQSNINIQEQNKADAANNDIDSSFYDSNISSLREEYKKYENKKVQVDGTLY